MVTQALCQSCGIPLEEDWIKGTEQNNIKSDLYCKFCYKNGHFIHPEINIEEMKKITETQMEKLALSPDFIKKVVAILPLLKRWKSQ